MDRVGDPIGTYIARLEPDLFGRRRTRRRIAEEVRGHLEDAIARSVAGGLPLKDAQQLALERFGPPDVVIGSWAESKGMGMATTFSRFGGLAGIIGAIGLTATMAYAEVSWTFSIGWFAEVALMFGALLAMGMIAVYMRLRGKLGRHGRFGFRLIIAGLIVGFGSSMLWFAPGGVLAIMLLVSGAGMYLSAALRTRVLPRGPLLMWATGVAFSVLVGVVGSITGTDTGLVAASTGYGLFCAGWVWLGAHLWTEPQRVENSDTALTA